MTSAAARALRQRYTLERSWTGARVREAIRAAWRARPRTTEHTGIMLWPTLYLPMRQDWRIALHMMGLAATGEYRLADLVPGRTGFSRATYERLIREASAAIAERMNAEAAAAA